MAIRYLYLTRHGHADPFGQLTATGREQARLLGARLAHIPFDAVRHSPLSRAADSARETAQRFRSRVPVTEAAELVDHIPYVPAPDETPASWMPFFDGYDTAEAENGQRIAQRLIDTFATTPEHERDIHELLITHAYPIAWLVRDALGAPPARWLGLDSANAALTVVEYRPGLPPRLVMFNEMSHLTPGLQWTGFPETIRP